MITISLIQADLAWQDKEANLDRFEEKINELSGETEIVILPEMFSTGFSMEAQELAESMTGSTVEWMKRMSAANRMIVAGSLIIEEDGNYYNRMIWMQPDGNYGVYDKRHLFGYAGEQEVFTPGSKRVITSVKGFRINLQVCYDLRFPVWSRQQTGENGEPEFDILVYSANWPERRSHAWKTLLSARAIENQCYVIGVNRVGNDGNNISYSGDSLIISPMGELLYHCAGDEDVFTIQLSRKELEDARTKFPFLKDADNFIIKGE